MSCFDRSHRGVLSLRLFVMACSLVVACGGANTDPGIAGGNTLLSVSRFLNPDLTASATFMCGDEMQERTLEPGFAEEGEPVWRLVFDLPSGDCTLLLRLFMRDGELVCQAAGTFAIVAEEENFLEVIPVCPP